MLFVYLYMHISIMSWKKMEAILNINVEGASVVRLEERRGISQGWFCLVLTCLVG
jgi:uridine phosphorylase